MIRKFLDGMHESDARLEIEHHREPVEIDQAVYHAVNFIQTRRSANKVSGDRRPKRYARRKSFEYDDMSEEDTFVEEELEEEHA